MENKKANWLKSFIKGLKPMKDSTNKMNMEILNKIYDRKPGERRSRMMNQVRMNTGEKPLSKSEQEIANKAIARRQKATKKKRDITDDKMRKNLNKLNTLSCVSASKDTIEETVRKGRETGAPWYSGSKNY